jgi:tetratricopeptide (TPR) repeat protein
MNDWRRSSSISQLSCISCYLIAALLSGSVTLAQSDKPWEGNAFSGDPAAIAQAASSVATAAGDDAVVLLHEARYVFESDGRSRLTERLVFRILTPQSVQEWATLQVMWKPWHQERPSIRARVITPDGAEYALDPETIGESPAAQSELNVFGDARVLQAPLPAIVPGAVVEEEIVVTETRPRFDAGVVEVFVFGGAAKVLESRLVIDAPTSLPIRYVTRLLPYVEPVRREFDGRVQLTFESDPLDFIQSVDAFAPSDEPQWPHIVFSTGSSWAEVAAAYARVVDSRIDDEALAEMTRDAIGEATTREEIAARLLEKVRQSVRYSGVEFGTASIVPATPSQALTRGYGDCKDQATLLVAMLRLAGIDSHVALLNPGPGADIEKDLPGFGTFTHAIVYVPGAPPLFIDPTDEFARAGELPMSGQGRLALIAAETTTGLIEIPDSTSFDNRTIETREVYLAERGPARIVETTETWGASELTYRYSFSQLSNADIHDTVKAYAKDAYGADAIAGVDYTAPQDLSRAFRMRFEASDVEAAVTDDSEAVVVIQILGLLGDLPQMLALALGEPESSAFDGSSSKTRTADIVLPWAYTHEWQYRIMPPPGFESRPLPESRVDALGAAVLSREFAVSEDGVVTATLRFDASRRRFSADDARELQEGIQGILDSPFTVVAFDQTGEMHLAASRIREALGEFRELAALHPTEALHRTQIARALLAGGLGQAARQEARRAISLEPSSPLAHNVLGLTLQHDLMGRELEKGADIQAAATAYRKAIELDPSNLVAHADLAILLEHDEQGFRYSPNAQLGEAIKEYESIQDQLDDSNPAFNNLPLALMWAGRFEELEAFIKENPQAPLFKQLLLVAISATQGAEAAVKEIRRVEPNEETRRAALLEAGAMLTQLRLYPEAAILLSSAARGHPNAAALLAQADSIGRTRRHEELPLQEDDPRTVVRRVFVNLFLAEAVEEILSLFTADTRKNPKEIDALEAVRRLLRSQLRKGGINPAVVVDLALGASEMTVEGDDSLGYRIRLRAATPGEEVDDTYFVVRREGSYRVLASSADVGVIGNEVLRRIDRGDLAGARRWLDWARQGQSLASADDPLAGPPFVRFWKQGSDAGVDSIRYAAASLLAETDNADRAIAILEEARRKAESEADRIRFDQALALAFASADRQEDLLPVARRLLQARPNSLTAFGQVLGSLARLEQWDEVERLAQERLSRHPDDPEALRVLAGKASSREGNFEKARQFHERLVALGEANATDFNNQAWRTLFYDPVPKEGLELAQRAVLLTESQSAASLHTLATLYAEAGKTTEAREVILQAMEIEAREEPSSDDWYVFGRIAEHYGEIEVAVAAYQKVEPPDPETADATYHLAQRRLGVLGQAETSVH